MNRARQLRQVTAIVVICSAMSLLFHSACGTSEVLPVDIAKDELCARCKSMIAEKQYAAEFITKDGFVRKFDDLSCMIQHAERVKRDSIAVFYAVDYASQHWIKAEEARFVRSDKFKTPRDGGILAFEDHSQAKALSTQFNAELLAFSDILK